MQTTETQVDVSAQCEHHLKQLQRHYRLSSTTAVIELLISKQLERSVYGMTGKRPGPKLVIDNTKEDHHANREHQQHLSGHGSEEPCGRPVGRPG